MPANEVFARPLVTAVHFQVTFPQLFSIDAKIGEYQSKIMREFPESSLLMRQSFVLVHRVNDPKETSPAMPPDLRERGESQQIWQFKNQNEVTVDVSRGSLVVSSLSHKTYSQDGHTRFRDTIKLICENFFELTRIPLIHRIGLRYVNDCPLSQKTTGHYRKYYNGALPLDRFPLEEARDMETTVLAERTNAMIRCTEKLVVNDQKCQLILDMDAWKEKIDSSQILDTADALHEVIFAEFTAFAKPDLLTYMRGNGDSP